MPEITKITIVSLIFVRYSIRNQLWKAKKPSFVLILLDVILLERPAPLLGRIRYILSGLEAVMTLYKTALCLGLIVLKHLRSRHRGCRKLTLFKGIYSERKCKQSH